MTTLSQRARALLHERHFAILATINDDGTLTSPMGTLTKNPS